MTEALLAQIRDVLLSDWDPIGVVGIPGAEDEYDTYAEELLVLLAADGTTAREVASHLLETATGLMGLPHSNRLAEKCERAAEALMRLAAGGAG